MLASFDCIHNLKSSPYFNQMRLYASAEGMQAVNPNVAGQKRRTVSRMPPKTPEFS